MPAPSDPSKARVRARRAGWLAFAVYGVLALAAYWPIWPGDPSRMPSCVCGDQVQPVWFLAWTPFALAHGHNPFLTNFIDYPTGVNTSVNALMPALGFLGAPLTLLFGPVSTLNFWQWLAFPLSATACFVLLRRWVPWTPAAFAGGLLYGFSPYLVGQASGHLNLSFVPMPPLILLLMDELLVRQRRRPVVVGALLGLAGGVQYLITQEVFASALVMAAIGVVLLAVSRPRLVAAHVRRALPGVASAVAVCGLLIGYPLSVQLTGPLRFTGSAHGTYPFPADLLGSVVPTVHQLLAPSALAATSSRFIGSDVAENGSYLGIPLLVVLVAVVVWRWRMPIVRFAAAMFLAAELLSLGPTLIVDTHATGIPLPDRLFDHLALFTSFADARFSLYVDLFAAVLLSIGLDQLRVALRRPRRTPSAAPGSPSRSPGWWRPVALAAVAAAALAPLIPDWPYASFPTEVPSLFTTAAVEAIPPGSVVMTYPYTQDTSDQGELWQATTSMRFRLLGGYAIVPGVDRLASYDAYPPSLQSVPATLTADDEGVPPAAVVPGASEASPVQVRAFLRRYDVGTVVADPVGDHPGRAITLLRSALGSPSHIGSLDVWLHVRRRVDRGP